jgi:hypothetical protein
MLGSILHSMRVTLYLWYANAFVRLVGVGQFTTYGNMDGTPSADAEWAIPAA